MAAKLNQIIAIMKGVKARCYGDITNLNKAIQHRDSFNGINREYRPLDAAQACSAWH